MPKIHWDRFLWINCVQLFVGTHGLYPTRLLCPRHFPGKNTRVVCLALLPTQGIFPTQGSNPHLQCLLYWIWILYLLSHWGSPIICMCVCVCVYIYIYIYVYIYICICIYMYMKEMATRSNILAWEILWTEEPGGLQSVGSQKSQTGLGE